jgi:hypothetical protein
MVRSSRADSGPQALPPAGATVPPWLPVKSARVFNLPACCALGPPACAAPCSCHHEACSARSACKATARPSFAHACRMALEGIVSKRKDSPYRSGRSPHWLKMKNPAAPAVKREAERIGAETNGDDRSRPGRACSCWCTDWTSIFVPSLITSEFMRSHRRRP